jgi:hypothetical protein
MATAAPADALLLAVVTMDGGGKISGAPVDRRTPAGVGTDNILDGSITEPKLATGAVSTRALADNSVTETKFADNAVDSRKLAEADGTSGQDANSGSGVKTPHIQDGAITQGKVAPQQISIRELKVASPIDGTVQIAAGQSAVVPSLPVRAGFYIPNIFLTTPGSITVAEQFFSTSLISHIPGPVAPGPLVPHPIDPTIPIILPTAGRQWLVTNTGSTDVTVGFRIYALAEQ